MCLCVLVPKLWGVCPCCNAVITRPGAPEAEKRGERWVEKGKKGWTGAKGGAGGLHNNRDQKR